MRAKSGRGPALTREGLALKLRQNWVDKHPTDTPNNGLDDSLTSLNWLQNLNIMKIAAPTPPSSPPLDKQLSEASMMQFSSNTQVNPNAVLNMTNIPGAKVKQDTQLVPTNQFRTIAGIEIAQPALSPLDNIDYKTNPNIKPPYSYATLICMAMRESQKKKITLSGIYNWITDNFMYYRMADPSWQNSIRHNLSLNKCFQKVARRKDEPGKGGFWRINPEYEDMFVNGIFKKRRCSPVFATTTPSRVAGDGQGPPPLKKIKRENDDSNSSMSSLSGLAMAGALPSLLTPMNSVDETQSAVQSIEIKKEAEAGNQPITEALPNDVSDAIDFSWNAILNQDIDVGGVKVKTEDIIDTPEGAASPITALSPPASDSNSEISLEDLLNTDFNNENDNPLDLTNGATLDLTISGIGLKAPEWWEESLNGKQFLSSSDDHSRMSTPVAIDDSDFAHPWAEEKSDSEMAMASFDKQFSNLFDIMDNLGSPKMSSDS